MDHHPTRHGRSGPPIHPLAGTAEHVITVTRGFSLAFFDHTLRDAQVSAFSSVDAPTDVRVFVYPLIADVTAERR
jgi:hypothetical protein